MSKVFAGNLTYVEAAKELRLPTSTVWHCFSEHWSVEAEGEKVTLRLLQQAETTEDFVTLLRKSIKKFILRLETAMEMPVTSYNEGAITKLSAELRALMRDILEFEGKLKSTPLIQLNVLQVQLQKLTSFLFSELCEGDRQKLLKILPELALNEPIGKIAENPPSES